jgi:hypothetical protein
VVEVEAAQAFFRQELGENWRQALLTANAVARLDDPVPEAEAAQSRAVSLVSAKRRGLQSELREQTAQAWKVLWLRDALKVSSHGSAPG